MFLFRLAIVFAPSFEARCQVENDNVVGAARTGDAPTISDWSAILLPTKISRNYPHFKTEFAKIKVYMMSF